VTVRRLLAAAATVLVAATGAGCSADDEPDAQPSASPSASIDAVTGGNAAPRPARPAPLPPDHACYRLSYQHALAPTSGKGPVPCRDSHTAQTFAVGHVASVVDGHLLAVDSDRVQAQVAQTCPRRFAAWVGGSTDDRRLSLLRAVWFTPTVAQSDKGADWFRCDVIALDGDEQLAPLTGRLEGVLDTEAGRRRWSLCGTAEPGTKSFERVLCSAESARWQALSVVGLAGLGPSYPGEKRVSSEGQDPCESAGRAVAEDTLNFEWSYEYPTREQWQNGQTYGVCWAPV
jgi:hypothetical protein